MKFKELLDQIANSPETIFESRDYNSYSKEELIELLNHFHSQFQDRYRFLIGEWRGARRAKDTRNGRFVSIQDVRDYLDGIID